MLYKEMIAGLMLIFFIPAAYGVNLEISCGEGSASGSLAIKLDAEDDAAVASQISVNGAEIIPAFKSSGRLNVFEQSHQATYSTGVKRAEAYVKVINGYDIEYSSKVSPAEGIVLNPSWISAEGWLDVSYADSTRCIAFANYKDQSASVLTEVLKGSIYGYHNMAYASEGYVMADHEIRDSHRKKGINGQKVATSAWASANAGINEGSVKASSNGQKSEGLDWSSLKACLFDV